MTIRTYCTHDLSRHPSLSYVPSLLLFDLTLSGTFWWLKAQTSYSKHTGKRWALQACPLPPMLLQIYCVDCNDPLLIPSAHTYACLSGSSHLKVMAKKAHDTLTSSASSGYPLVMKPGKEARPLVQYSGLRGGLRARYQQLQPAIPYHSSLTVLENVQLWTREQIMIVCKVSPKWRE